MAKTNPHKLTKKQNLMIESLGQQLGNITVACNECKVSRQTHYDWIRKNPLYAKAVERVQDELLDMAENSLHRQILDKNVQATMFYLKNKGRVRGYADRQEISVSGGVSDFVKSFNETYEKSLNSKE